jgi:hypothetical protein
LAQEGYRRVHALSFSIPRGVQAKDVKFMARMFVALGKIRYDVVAGMCITG